MRSTDLQDSGQLSQQEQPEPVPHPADPNERSLSLQVDLCRSSSSDSEEVREIIPADGFMLPNMGYSRLTNPEAMKTEARLSYEQDGLLEALKDDKNGLQKF